MTDAPRSGELVALGLANWIRRTRGRMLGIAVNKNESWRTKSGRAYMVTWNLHVRTGFAEVVFIED